MSNWNEVYRPNSLDEVVGHDEDIADLKQIVKDIHEGVDDGACPNIFVSGPPGTGKTTIVTCFLKDAFGPDYKENYKAYNASDIGIDVIRKGVMDLSAKPPLGTYKAPNGEVYDIPFNLIFLDEIDALPNKSQDVMRRVMEESAHITKYVLSCNHAHKVSEALISRCVPFHFGRLKPKDIISLLKPIIEKEDIEIDNDALELLGEASNGDARRGQNLLYKAQLQGKVDVYQVKRVSNIILEKFNTRILQIAIVANGKSDKEYAKDFKMLESNVDKLYYDQGYSATQILINIFDAVVADEKMPVALKRKLFESMAECMRDCSLVGSDLYAMKMWLRGLK